MANKPPSVPKVGRAYLFPDGLVRWVVAESVRGLFRVLWLDSTRGVWCSGSRYRLRDWPACVEALAPKRGERVKVEGPMGLVVETDVACIIPVAV
jgi:hypothetical protein